jgi:LuxR family transcriptional regulator, maltose regulon positive regulatory protein
MSTPLLATKLYVPLPRPEMVPRPHLLQRLDEGLRLGHRLSLVSAPAGFGKTTLLSAWVRSLQQPVSWLSLDEADDELHRFLTYLVAALQETDDHIGQAMQELWEAAGCLPIDRLMVGLINSIAAIPTPIVLILDDYQAIGQPEIHQVVTFLLDHCPPQLHLVIASREDPPLPLSQLRARGQIMEIRERDLRFTTQESLVFLNQVMDLELTADEVSMLETRTEGWVAGLQLAALSLRDRANTQDFVQSVTGTHRHILDYLTDEVLERQPEQVRTFLLYTSILDRLTGSLCNALTGEENGQDTLELLDSTNLFIIPLDDERRWYRYHPLFRDLLRYYLKQEVSTQALVLLHGRACAWLAQHGLKAEALPHAIAGQDLDCAANLIEAIAAGPLLRGKVETLKAWLDELPRDLIQARPLLSVIRAWTYHMDGQRDAIEPHLIDAERSLQMLGLPDDDPFASDLRGQIAAMRASKARHRGEWPLFFRCADEALELLAEDSLAVRTTLNANLGLAYMLRADLRAAMAAFREVQSLGQASGNMISAVNCIGFLAAILIAQGRLRQAGDLCRHTIDSHLEHCPEPLPTLGHVHASLARVLYEWNDLAAAAAHLEQAVILGEQTHLPSTLRFRASMLNRIWQMQGTEQHLASPPPQIAKVADREQENLDDADLTAWRVRHWLDQGDVAMADRWAETYRGDKPSAQIWRPYGDLALARVLIARQQWEEALDRLTQIRRLALEAGGGGWVIESLVLEALAHQTMGQSDRGLAAVSEALSLAEPEGYVRTFVDEGEPMATLLGQVWRHGVSPHYVGALLAAFRAGLPATSAGPQTTPAHLLYEALTERELEVLHLIDAGLSNREIASRLYVSLNTVRTHTKNLYSKLGVHSRTQAITRARDLGLL